LAQAHAAPASAKQPSRARLYWALAAVALLALVLAAGLVGLALFRASP
jgi:hypothetical protein